MGTRTHTHIEMKSLIGFYIGQRPSENLCEKCFGSTFDLFAFGGFHRIVNVRYCFGAHHSFPLNIIMPMRRLLFLSVSVFELGQIFQSKWNQCRWFSFEINKCPLINIWRVKRVFLRIRGLCSFTFNWISLSPVHWWVFCLKWGSALAPTHWALNWSEPPLLAILIVVKHLSVGSLLILCRILQTISLEMHTMQKVFCCKAGSNIRTIWMTLVFQYIDIAVAFSKWHSFKIEPNALFIQIN